MFPANVHPYVERFHELFGHRLRFIRYGTAAVLAFILALPATSQWQEWMLFRNSVPFEVRDPQFGIDVGFYVFRLPFITFAIDWLFAALVIVLLLTMAAHLLNGGVLFTSSTPTVRPATRIHFAALLAVLAAVKAADYWYTRYDLTNENRGFVQGATYTVVKAQIPATDAADAHRAAHRRRCTSAPSAPTAGGCRWWRRRCGSWSRSSVASPTRRSCRRRSCARTRRSARRRTSPATSRPPAPR